MSGKYSRGPYGPPEGQKSKNVQDCGVQKLGPKPRSGIFLANVRNARGIIFSLLGNYLGPLKIQFSNYLYVWGYPHWIIYLREFVYELPSSWPPARVEGGSGQQSMTPDPGESAGSGGSAGKPDCSRRLVIEQHSHTFGILAGPNLGRPLKNLRKIDVFGSRPRIWMGLEGLGSKLA